MTRDQDTERRIFEAAQAAFHEQGFDGARMADIARRAAINQSMLHYYFRSKDLLFEAVFRKAAAEVLGRAIGVLNEDLPLYEKLDRFVTNYITAVAANPHVPAFVIQELRRNPDLLRRMVGDVASGAFSRFRTEVDEATGRGVISPVAPEHLITSVLAMCIFPFIARPMLQVGLGTTDPEFDAFLAERVTHVTAFIRNALRP